MKKAFTLAEVAEPQHHTKARSNAFTLAEVAEPQQHTKAQSNAFTLAEVLITLGIIGIVAAMTIPTLISNYQKKQWVAGLQKGYAVLNNAFKMMLAEENVNNIYHTTFGRDTDMPNCYANWAKDLGKYMKITKVCNPDISADRECFKVRYKLLSGESGYDDEVDFVKEGRLKIYAADGIVYYFRTNHPGLNLRRANGIGSYVEAVADIDIDVTGDSGPNQYGRDLFNVLLIESGELVFPGSGLWIDGGGKRWDDSATNSKCDPKVANWSSGDYCGARIFESGWRMDY